MAGNSDSSEWLMGFARSPRLSSHCCLPRQGQFASDLSADFGSTWWSASGFDGNPSASCQLDGSPPIRCLFDTSYDRLARGGAWNQRPYLQKRASRLRS